jgi:hypothetical protein
VGEGEVRKRTLIVLAAALNVAIAGAACSSARGNESGDEGRASGSGDAVTIAGCLSGQDGRFVLTAAPDAAGAIAARSVGDERETHSYVLTGGSNLQEHLGKRVEVVGTIEGGAGRIDHDAKKTTTTAAPAGGDTPTVATKEEVEMEAKRLTVREVRPVAGTCQLTQ